MNMAQISSPKSTKPMPMDMKGQKKPGPSEGTKDAQAAMAKPKMDKSVETKGKTGVEAKEQQPKEIQEYLQAINRLEQSLISQKIKPEELEISLSNLETKLLALKPEQKKKLLGMEFFVKNKIEDLKTLKSHMTTALEHEKERTEVIDLLKNKQFIALLHDLPGTKDQTYNQGAKSNQAQVISTREIKA